MTNSASDRVASASLSETPIDPAAVIAAVSKSGNGGIAVFIGTVRDVADGRPVLGLDYSAYVEMAEREMASIVAEAANLDDGIDVAAVHRIGSLAIGDVAVVIAAAHPHRAAAFDACRYVVEQIKRRVPIWKAERYADGGDAWVGSPVAHAEQAS
jgi:molybdopterin synthase catalytic subunit